ncbi:MAG TPA: peptidase U32 family protein, partial [Geobacteraceae bacterium]
MKIPELLAPAGNMEKLRVALHYGADAVYLGGKEFGLRQMADNFTRDELARAVDCCHCQGAKAYLTLNSYLHESDLERLPRFLADVAAIPFDAFIVADPGVIETLREYIPDAELHLSTQANTVNWRSAQFWHRQGIRRINLARELSLEEIRHVVARVPMEFEVFVHGAMCISYSGRCLLSSIMADRNANQGACAHPCRWNYALVEEKRPGEYFPVTEDGNGTFIFNSKDLCLLPHLPRLVESGVASLKIEGRMKGVNYVASVVRVYREALDRFADNPENYHCRPEWLEELSKISHRGYTSGFLLGPPGRHDHEYHSRYLRTHDFVGIVEEVGDDGRVVIGVRNRMCAGDTVEFVGRGMRSHAFTLPPMETVAGEDSPTVLAANP